MTTDFLTSLYALNKYPLDQNRYLYEKRIECLNKLRVLQEAIRYTDDEHVLKGIDTRDRFIMLTTKYNAEYKKCEEIIKPK